MMQPVDILARSSQPVLREDLFLHNEGEVSATTMQIRASRDVEVPAFRFGILPSHERVMYLHTCTEYIGNASYFMRVRGNLFCNPSVQLSEAINNNSVNWNMSTRWIISYIMRSKHSSTLDMTCLRSS